MNKARARRIWMFRALAVLLGVLPLVAVEGLLRLFDLPRQRAAVDPFVDTSQIRPLFELDSQADIFAISAERMDLFRPASFSATKAKDAYRVFALGGSTTQGEPFSTETAFPKWLEINLQLALPAKRVEVINCGGLSYASYRVLAIMREVMAYQPDLIVVYTGHNEYLERRAFDGYEKASTLERTVARLSQLRTVQFGRLALYGEAARHEIAVENPTQLASEVDALLDYQGGLADYHRGDRWTQLVPEQFRWSLQQMTALSRESQVPLVLVNPTSNLLDCPPMKMETAPGLTAREQTQFLTDWEAAKQLAANTPEQAIETLRALLERDRQHAGVHFLLGRLLFESQQYELAAEHLVAARDYDVCPLRATSEIRTIVAAVAQNADIPLCDAHAVFASRSDHGLVGKDWLVDHIHPLVKGNQVLGEEIISELINEQIIAPSATDWQAQRKSAYAAHLSSLGEEYYHRARQRLEGLRLWTQGRAKKVRPE